MKGRFIILISAFILGISFPAEAQKVSVSTNFTDWANFGTAGGVSMDIDGSNMAYSRQIYSIPDPDKREKTLQGRSYYNYLKETLYPRLRTVKFNFYLHRKGMVKDTVHTTVIDSTYMRGVQALRDMDYAGALALLSPYRDFNTAVAFMGLDRNANALNILEDQERTPEVNYLLAILYSRTGNQEPEDEEFY